MWSNLNDSFSAISGTISTLRHSIPSIPFVEHEKTDEEHIRDLKTKLSLLKNEVVRHRDIALLYKDRWLKAEQVIKSTGQESEDYHDEINLLDEPEGGRVTPLLSSSPPLLPSVQHPLSSLPEDGLSTVPLTDDVITSPVDESRHPKSIKELALDSSVVRIHQLEDELKKVDVDRQHWRTLAKQKQNVEEDLEEAKLQIETYSIELRKSASNNAELVVVKEELETQLQELDAQHEQALAKVIRMRDEALDRNVELEGQLLVLLENDKKKEVVVTEAETNTDGLVLSQDDGGDDRLVGETCRTGGGDEVTKQKDQPDDEAKIIDEKKRRDNDDDAEDVNTSMPLTTTKAIDDRQVQYNTLIRKLFDLVPEFAVASSSSDDHLDPQVIDRALDSLRSKVNELQELRIENSSLESRLSQSANTLAQVQSQCARKDEQLDELESAVQSLEDELEESRKKVSGGKQNRTNENELRKTIEQLEAKIEELMIQPTGEQGSSLPGFREEPEGASASEVVKLVNEPPVTTSVDDSLKEEIRALELKLNNCEVEREKIVEQLSARTVELEDARSKHALLEQDLKKTIEEKAEVMEHLTELDRLKQENDLLHTTYASLETHCHHIYEQYQQTLQQLEEVRKVQSDLPALQTQIQQSNEQVRILSEEKDLARKQIDAKEKELLSFTVELEKQLALVGRLEGELNTRGDDSSQIEALQNELRMRAADSEKQSADLVQLKEAVNRMSALVQEKDQEVIQCRVRVGQLESQLTLGGDAAQVQQSEIDRLRQELDRLRAHLVQVEENYTAELMNAEQRGEEMLAEMEKMQADKTVVSQYDEQIRGLVTARDKARNEVSALEDKVQQYSTSIGNLQGVIEQLEKEHERKLRSAELDHKSDLEQERQRTAEVVRKLAQQEERLRESMEALEAASRLSETIDQKEFQLNQLRRELKNKDHDIEQLYRKIADLEVSYEGKVDKQIVKSLLISYFATVPGSPARTEGERLMARFLDFNQQEMERAGIKIGKQARAGGANDSFTFKFVEFLEAESSKATGGTGVGQDGAPRRKDSTASNASNHNSQNVELARDLNKRLNMLGSGTGPRPNPFVPQPQSSYQHHHRTPSSTSSASSTSDHHLHMNQLLQQGGVPITPVLFGTVPPTQNQNPAGTRGVNISDVVRGAVESEDNFI